MDNDIEFQISETEKIIEIKKQCGKDASFEKSLVKAWKEWLRREQHKDITEAH